VTSNRTCEPCSGDCLTCTSPQHCTSCLKSLPQKYLHVSSCISPCPTQTFADSMSLQCRPCVFPCQTCTDSLNCLSCEIGFLNLQTNRCDFCPANEFADLKTKSCVPCNTTIKDCATCTNETWCTRCVLGGFLYMGGCVTEQQCARVDGYYLNTQQGACVQCISPCRTCVSQIACTACLTGFLIQANSTCSNRCPFSFYADSNSKVCLPCNYTVCRTCTNTPNTCLDCFNDSSRPSTNLNFSILFNRTCINSSSCPK
jgi:proprotein convertase subtilisin/kexin type 5